MAKIKLMYFNSMGRAEIPRLILAQAGAEYEDFRFTREQWPEIKPSKTNQKKTCGLLITRLIF